MNMLLPTVINKIEFTTVDDVTFIVPFRGNRVVVLGDSGTGKSYFANTLNTFIHSPRSIPILEEIGFEKRVIVLNYSNHHLIDFNNFKDALKRWEGKLIILDNADLYLTPRVVKNIKECDFCQFLVYSRKYFLWDMSPNYYGEFKRYNKIIKLEYESDMKSWF